MENIVRVPVLNNLLPKYTKKVHTITHVCKVIKKNIYMNLLLFTKIYPYMYLQVLDRHQNIKSDPDINSSRLIVGSGPASKRCRKSATLVTVPTTIIPPVYATTVQWHLHTAKAGSIPPAAASTNPHTARSCCGCCCHSATYQLSLITISPLLLSLIQKI
jgi:hypothetical protein